MCVSTLMHVCIHVCVCLKIGLFPWQHNGSYKYINHINWTFFCQWKCDIYESIQQYSPAFEQKIKIKKITHSQVSCSLAFSFTHSSRQNLSTCSHKHIQTHTHSHHAFVIIVRYAPEGVCGKEIHYFSFCLTLLCEAQQLKGHDQPTITIHNGFSASSTSLEACLRSGLSPCAPASLSPRLQPLPPLMPVGGGDSGPWLWLWQRKTPLKRSGVSQCNWGPLSLSDHATTGAPGCTAGWLYVLSISLEFFCCCLSLGCIESLILS